MAMKGTPLVMKATVFISISLVYDIQNSGHKQLDVQKVHKTLDRLSRSRLRLGYSKLDKYTRHAREQIIVDNHPCSTELTGQG